jgi:hypothetical protein
MSVMCGERKLELIGEVCRELAKLGRKGRSNSHDLLLSSALLTVRGDLTEGHRHGLQLHARTKPPTPGPSDIEGLQA